MLRNKNMTAITTSRIRPPTDTQRVFSKLGVEDEAFANKLAIAFHLKKPMGYSTLIKPLLIKARDWATEEKDSAYRIVASLWHREHEELKAMIPAEQHTDYMKPFLEFLRNGYSYIITWFGDKLNLSAAAA